MMIIESGFCRVRAHFLCFFFLLLCYRHRFKEERKKSIISHLIQNSYFPFIFYLFLSNCPIANGNAYVHLSIDSHITTYCVLAHSNIGVADNGHTFIAYTAVRVPSMYTFHHFNQLYECWWLDTLLRNQTVTSFNKKKKRKLEKLTIVIGSICF